jgi:hypothetical protein
MVFSYDDFTRYFEAYSDLSLLKTQGSGRDEQSFFHFHLPGLFGH